MEQLKNRVTKKSCTRSLAGVSVLVLQKKDAFQNTDFSRFKYQFKRKNCHSMFVKIFQVSKCPCLTFSAAISRLNARSHWFLASTHSNFNLIGSCNRNLNTQSHRDTYAHTTVSYFLKIAKKQTNKNRILSTGSILIKLGAYRIQVIFNLRGRFHFTSLTPTTQAK